MNRNLNTAAATILAVAASAVIGVQPARADWFSTTYRSGVEVNNFATADAIILPANIQGSGSFANVNFADVAQPGGGGNFGANNAVPGLSNAVDNDDFAIVSTGRLTVTTTGVYHFRNNTDDGSRLRISGVTLIADNVLDGDHNAFGTAYLVAGRTYSIEHMWYERAGGAQGETSVSQNAGAFQLFGGGAAVYGLNVDQGTPDALVGISTGWLSSTYQRQGSAAIGNLADANDAINNGILAGTGTFQTVNFQNNGGSDGNFGGDVNVPGLPLNSDNFAVLSVALLTVTEAGTYQFRNNTDDGSYLEIDGNVVILDDVLSGPHNADGSIFLGAGTHNIRHIWFEAGGGAAGELAIRRFDNGDYDTPFYLLGSAEADLATGVFVGPIPEPSTWAMMGAAVVGGAVVAVRRRSAKAGVRA